MLSQLLKPSAIRSASVLGQVTKNRTQARFLASVQTNTARESPSPQRNSTPISTERATFTIKVCTIAVTEKLHHSLLFRMAPSSPENLLAPKPTYLAKQCLQPRLWGTPSP
jgi:hypothetical protein